MFVCTLPSPACMCNATNTRPRSTRLWISPMRFRTGPNASPSKISFSGAWSSRFQETTVSWLCNAGNVSSSRSSRSCQRARTAAISSRASCTFASIRSCGACASSSSVHTCWNAGDVKQLTSSSASFSLFAIDNSMLIRSTPSV